MRSTLPIPYDLHTLLPYIVDTYDLADPGMLFLVTIALEISIIGFMGILITKLIKNKEKRFWQPRVFIRLSTLVLLIGFGLILVVNHRVISMRIEMRKTTNAYLTEKVGNEHNYSIVRYESSSCFKPQIILLESQYDCAITYKFEPAKYGDGIYHIRYNPYTKVAYYFGDYGLPSCERDVNDCSFALTVEDVKNIAESFGYHPHMRLAMPSDKILVWIRDTIASSPTYGESIFVDPKTGEVFENPLEW